MALLVVVGCFARGHFNRKAAAHCAMLASCIEIKDSVFFGEKPHMRLIIENVHFSCPCRLYEVAGSPERVFSSHAHSNDREREF